ncbi:hypothetical protein HUO13_22525 [Saccharopolyspora erythraea]|uniref:hypothetical protein n=1 Tax=Saccharopolyspora erythraea TaxID=1836 RepID=UPI001BAC2D5C|nr:hypothetical protein [Saccharopolyspora erythraea]QUH03234.1 hypothetical protein HUO13_22525 [Saccharopolyspora erythraea]
MPADRLPLPDYDELPIGQLRHRIRSLQPEQVRELLEHEQRHGHRLPVEELLTARLQELEEGAEPSPGSPESMPETPGHTRGGSPVAPGSGRGPSGPPPRHGIIGEQGRPNPNS